MEKRISAFTIMEVTVTMLITAIVIAITFTSFSIILRYYHSINQKNTDMTQLIVLDHLLKRDFDEADTIFKTQEGIALKKGSRMVRYEFNSVNIVRKAAGTDTFKVQNQVPTVLFENKPVNTAGETAEQNRVDEFVCHIIYQQQEIPLHYKKIYSSENLINRTDYAIN